MKYCKEHMFASMSDDMAREQLKWMDAGPALEPEVGRTVEEWNL